MRGSSPARTSGTAAGSRARRVEGCQNEAHAVSGATSGHDSAESEALHPDFPVRDPEPDFDLGSRFYRRRSFNQAAACAGVGKIAPDGIRVFIHAQFHSHETFDPWVLAPVTSPVRAE